MLSVNSVSSNYYSPKFKAKSIPVNKLEAAKNTPEYKKIADMVSYLTDNYNPKNPAHNEYLTTIKNYFNTLEPKPEPVKKKGLKQFFKRLFA